MRYGLIGMADDCINKINVAMDTYECGVDTATQQEIQMTKRYSKLLCQAADILLCKMAAEHGSTGNLFFEQEAKLKAGVGRVLKHFPDVHPNKDVKLVSRKSDVYRVLALV